MTTNNVNNYATGASGTVLTGNGVGSTPTFQAAASASGRLLSETNFSAGSGTYTVPAGVHVIEVQCVGAGAGGGGCHDVCITHDDWRTRQSEIYG